MASVSSDTARETRNDITYRSFSSRSEGIVISSCLSTCLDADSSSKETALFLRHISSEGSVKKTAKTPSSLMIGWFLYVNQLQTLI